MSGWMVDRRDQVRITFLSFAWFIVSIFTIRCVSINGPFLVERAISVSLLATTTDDERIGTLVVACLVATRRLTPRCHRMTAARSFALAAAVWVIDRIHRHAAVGRADTLPAVASRLTDGHVLVIGVTHLADCRHALHQHATRLAGRQLQQRVVAFLRDQLRLPASRTHHLRALARAQ